MSDLHRLLVENADAVAAASIMTREETLERIAEIRAARGISFAAARVEVAAEELRRADRELCREERQAALAERERVKRNATREARRRGAGIPTKLEQWEASEARRRPWLYFKVCRTTWVKKGKPQPPAGWRAP